MTISNTIKLPTIQPIQVATIDTNNTTMPNKSNTQPKQQQLKRILTVRQLLVLGIGATIGAGIFVVTGVVARTQTGPALFLSYILSACVCILSALCYAEMSSIVPSSGSAYSYVAAVMGQPYGYIVGWDLALEYALQTALVAKGFSQHFSQLYYVVTGSHFPTIISTSPYSCTTVDNEFVCSATGSIMDLPAIVINLFITTLIVFGVKKSTQFNAVVVTIKISVVMFVIICGLWYIDVANYVPFMPYGFISFNSFSSNSSNGSSNTVGVFAGAAVVFYAFLGFDSIACQAEDAKNPKKDIPIAICLSVGISTILYVAVSLVLVGMVRYDMIDLEAPVSAAFALHGLSIAEFIIALGACIGMTAVMMSFMLAQPRVLLSMSRDGYVPATIYSSIHYKYATPYRSTIANGIMCIFLSFLPYQLLIRLVNIGTIMGFTLVCVCVIILHYKKPSLYRPFRTPLSPLIPVLGVIANMLLLIQLDRLSWIRYVIWLAIGLIVYAIWGRKNAYHIKSQPDYIPLYQLNESHKDADANNNYKNHTTAIDLQTDDNTIEHSNSNTIIEMSDIHNNNNNNNKHYNNHHHYVDNIDYSVPNSMPPTPETKPISLIHKNKSKNKLNNHNNIDHDHNISLINHKIKS